MTGRRCDFVKDDGSRCGAFACQDGTDDGKCYYHDPGLEEKRQLSRERGGQARSLNLKEQRQFRLQTLDPPDPPETLRDCHEVAAWTMSQVARGRLEDSTARVLLAACKEFRQAYDSRMEEEQTRERLATVHARLVEQGQIEPDDPAWLREKIHLLERKLRKLEEGRT